MLEASAEFLDQMDKLPFTVLVGGVAVDELELEGSWCAGAFSLGGACAAGFTAKVTADSLSLGRGDWVEVTAVLGENSLPLGTFQLTRVSRATDSREYTLAGEDAMAAVLGEEFIFAESPADAPALLSAIAAQSGLTVVGGDSLPATPVEVEPGSTMRELVGELALLCGGNARIDRQGRLRLEGLTQTGGTVTPQRYYESALALEEEFCFGALTVTVGEEVFTAQSDGLHRGLALRSQWMTQEEFDALWARWQGVAFTPGRVETLGNLLLDPGDIITITDRAGTDHSFPILSLRHRFDGGWRTTLTAAVPEGSQTAPPQTVSQIISGLKVDLGRFRRLYADELHAAVGEIDELKVEVLKAHTILVTKADGTVVLKADADTGELIATAGSIAGLEMTDKTLSATYRHDYPAYTDEDITKAQAYLLGTGTLTDEELANYDVNMDGRVTSADLLAMQAMISGTQPNYSVYTLTISPNDPTGCLRLEVTEGFQAGKSAVLGLGVTSLRSLAVSGKTELAGDVTFGAPYASRRSLEVAQAVEDTEHSGCFYRAVDEVTEWINPPMELGVEYRTTERWLGKPVYTKAVDFGALPNASSKNVLYTSSAVASVISLHGVLSDGCCVNSGTNVDRAGFSDYTIIVDNTHWNVRVLTNGDLSALTAVFQVKYVYDES